MGNGLGQQAGFNPASVRVLRGSGLGAVRLPAAGSVAGGLAAEIQAPDRGRHQAEFERLAEEISRLIPLWPEQLLSDTPMQRARLLVRVRRHMRAEHQRGIAGHWTYCTARASNIQSNFNAMRKAAKQC